MHASDTLHIAEIPFESGGIRFRYARRKNADGTQWIRHGRFVAYYESGAVKREGEYVDGKEEGLWRAYHANGQVAAEGRYSAGKEEGMWHFFDADGKEEKSSLYRDGVEL
jgi:antitoxin component YwqK of YwqJK toxin-antitoxin module